MKKMFSSLEESHKHLQMMEESLYIYLRNLRNEIEAARLEIAKTREVFLSELSQTKELQITFDPLSARTNNILKHLNINSLVALISYSEKDLLRIPGMGAGSLNELKHMLHKKGLKLKDEE